MKKETIKLITIVFLFTFCFSMLFMNPDQQDKKIVEQLEQNKPKKLGPVHDDTVKTDVSNTNIYQGETVDYEISYDPTSIDFNSLVCAMSSSSTVSHNTMEIYRYNTFLDDGNEYIYQTIYSPDYTTNNYMRLYFNVLCGGTGTLTYEIRSRWYDNPTSYYTTAIDSTASITHDMLNVEGYLSLYMQTLASVTSNTLQQWLYRLDSTGAVLLTAGTQLTGCTTAGIQYYYFYCDQLIFERDSDSGVLKTELRHDSATTQTHKLTTPYLDHPSQVEDITLKIPTNWELSSVNPDCSYTMSGNDLIISDPIKQYDLYFTSGIAVDSEIQYILAEDVTSLVSNQLSFETGSITDFVNDSLGAGDYLELSGLRSFDGSNALYVKDAGTQHINLELPESVEGLIYVSFAIYSISYTNLWFVYPTDYDSVTSTALSPVNDRWNVYTFKIDGCNYTGTTYGDLSFYLNVGELFLDKIKIYSPNIEHTVDSKHKHSFEGTLRQFNAYDSLPLGSTQINLNFSRSYDSSLIESLSVTSDEHGFCSWSITQELEAHTYEILLSKTDMSFIPHPIVFTPTPADYEISHLFDYSSLSSQHYAWTNLAVLDTYDYEDYFGNFDLDEAGAGIQEEKFYYATGDIDSDDYSHIYVMFRAHTSIKWVYVTDNSGNISASAYSFSIGELSLNVWYLLDFELNSDIDGKLNLVITEDLTSSDMTFDIDYVMIIKEIQPILTITNNIAVLESAGSYEYNVSIDGLFIGLYLDNEQFLLNAEAGEHIISIEIYDSSFADYVLSVTYTDSYVASYIPVYDVELSLFTQTGLGVDFKTVRAYMNLINDSYRLPERFYTLEQNFTLYVTDYFNVTLKTLAVNLTSMYETNFIDIQILFYEAEIINNYMTPVNVEIKRNSITTIFTINKNSTIYTWITEGEYIITCTPVSSNDYESESTTWSTTSEYSNFVVELKQKAVSSGFNFSAFWNGIKILVTILGLIGGIFTFNHYIIKPRKKKLEKKKDDMNRFMTQRGLN